MKRKLVILVSLLLVFTLVLSGCNAAKTNENTNTSSGATSPETTAKPEPKEVVTLEFMNNSANTGLQEGYWWTKILEEEVGVKLNIIQNKDDVVNAYIAAGNLPDISFLRTNEQVSNAKNAGLLVNFDDYAHLLTSVFATYPKGSIQYQRDRFDDGGLYTIPSGATNEAITYGPAEYYMRVDWPYFEEYVKANGEPKLTDIEDFLPIFKWIQDAHPQNEDGLPAYGMSIFKDWDAGIMGYVEWLGQQLGILHPYYLFTEVDMETLDYWSMFQDSSTYKRILKLLYNANQMGILDPDSMTQTWDDYCAKVDARRVYSTYCFVTNEYTKALPYENMKTVSNNIGPMYLGNSWGGWVTVVSSTSKHIERACEFINFCINEDNWWRLRFGEKGEFWDINEDGQVYVTDFGKQMQEDPDVNFKDGGNISGINMEAWNWRPISYHVISKTYGAMFYPKAWPTRDVSDKDEVQKSWEAYMADKYNIKFSGYLSDIQVLNASNTFATYRYSVSSETAPDDIIDKVNRIGAVVTPTSWKMVYAKNEAEFENLWKSLCEQANKMGADELVKYYGDMYINGIETAKKYID
jgi:putative aldouronate transport system substrate-binding protein